GKKKLIERTPQSLSIGKDFGKFLIFIAQKIKRNANDGLEGTEIFSLFPMVTKEENTYSQNFKNWAIQLNNYNIKFNTSFSTPGLNFSLVMENSLEVDFKSNTSIYELHADPDFLVKLEFKNVDEYSPHNLFITMNKTLVAHCLHTSCTFPVHFQLAATPQFPDWASLYKEPVHMTFENRVSFYRFEFKVQFSPFIYELHTQSKLPKKSEAKHFLEESLKDPRTNEKKSLFVLTDMSEELENDLGVPFGRALRASCMMPLNYCFNFKDKEYDIQASQNRKKVIFNSNDLILSFKVGKDSFLHNSESVIDVPAEDILRFSIELKSEYQLNAVCWILGKINYPKKVHIAFAYCQGFNCHKTFRTHLTDLGIDNLKREDFFKEAITFEVYCASDAESVAYYPYIVKVQYKIKNETYLVFLFIFRLILFSLKK
ncbi:hypothetical protein HMI54_008937, partial [Coelomomyces lativittatus]